MRTRRLHLPDGDRGHAANKTLYAGKLKFDPVKGFAPISLVAIAPIMVSDRTRCRSRHVIGTTGSTASASTAISPRLISRSPA